MAINEPIGQPASDVGREAPDLLLVQGGPLYRLLLRCRLVKSPMRLLPRRMLFVMALAWLPLLVLSLVEGRAVSGVNVPLLSDLEIYARFLLALPILIAAENAVHLRVPEMVNQFRERGIVAAAQDRFDDAVVNATRAANSATAELLLFAFAVIVGPWLWQYGLALQTDTWYADAGAEGIAMTTAGYWLIHVSTPIFQFLLLRWYYRLAVWWWFMWKVSRLPLRLAAVHPDRSGGIGFLGEGCQAFMALLFAQAVVVAGLIASRVIYSGAEAVDFRAQVALVIILLVAMVLVPMLFFIRDISLAQREGNRRYGWLATLHARDFERKWFSGTLPPGEPLLGSPDMSSLADLAAAGDSVREMRMLPFGWRTFLLLVAAATAPFLPLVLTVIPLAELLKDAVMMLL
jgi:hypothetical protein